MKPKKSTETDSGMKKFKKTSEKSDKTENKESKKDDNPNEKDTKPNADTASFLASVKVFLTTKPTRKQLLVIFVVFIVLIGAGFALKLVLDGKKESPQLESIVEQEINPEPVIATVASKLTGVETTLDLNERPVIGVMIENSIDARPQSGLIDAGIVFEAIAEGGITRFLALYQIGQPDSIGPIRSARPYYVQWAAGFDAAYTHSGGSPQALSLIRSLGVKDMDHGNYPGYFSRVNYRFAPHNVYTSMQNLDNLRKERGFNSSEFKEFARLPFEDEEEQVDEATTENSETNTTEALEEETADERELASTIEFNISGPLYNTSYIYDAESNTYARKMAGQKHFDQVTEKQLKPSVIIALITEKSNHPNGVHTVYKTTGNGKILVFQNGEVIEGEWSKSSSKSELKFTDSKGKTLPLQPGQTWITAIQSGRTSYAP